MRSQLETIERERGGQAGSAGLSESTRDLRAAIEELYVAEEELRLQHAELLGARTELEDQRRRYEELFQLAPDAYIVTDPRGIVREVNRAAADLVGVEARFLLGKPLMTFVDTQDRPDLRALINTFGAGSQVADWSLTSCPGTAPRAVSASASAARDGRNELVGIRWIFRDVTVRERSERALLTIADRGQTILDAAPMGICRLDGEGSIDVVNAAASQLLGRSPADLRGRQLLDVFLEGQADTEVASDSRFHLERAFGALRPGSGHWDYIEPSGGRRLSLSYALATLVEAGSPTGSWSRSSTPPTAGGSRSTCAAARTATP